MMGKCTRLAWKIAVEAHGDQMYGSKPYIHHLLQVFEGTKRSAKAYNPAGVILDEVCAVAILHDVLEDTDITPGKLVIAGLPFNVVSSIITLTKYKGEDYDRYISGIKKDTMALMVKREDTMKNLTQSQKEGNNKRIIKYSNQLKLLYEV
jgi:(p)ppGpp synthase/HD superfamily hydrolase